MQLNQWKRETAGSQIRREEETNSTLPKCHHVAQCPYYCKEFGHSSDDRGVTTGGKQLHATYFSPAWPRSTSEKDRSFLSLQGWRKSPTSMVGSAHIRYISLLLLTSPSISPSLQA